MLRRVFLLQILLGWLITVVEKLGVKLIHSPVTVTLAGDVKTIEPINLYIATYGDDSWSGRHDRANLEQNDGPLATLARAKVVIRELKSQPQNLQRPIQVMLRGGTYFISEPVLFEPEDSGRVNQPITYRSYPKEQATLSGGRLITGWQLETVNGLKMWTVELPQTTQKFQQLWVNGSRRSRSRYPSQGYLQVKSLDPERGQTWKEGNSHLEYHREDFENFAASNPDTFLDAFKYSSQGSGQDSELIVMTRWVESRLPITKIDPAQGKIYFSKASVFQLAPGDLYYLENALEWLNTPGEWYLNQQNQQYKLFYLPLPGEDLETSEIIAPVVDSLLIFQGNASDNSYVQHLKFSKLTFSHASWQLPTHVSGYNQNAWEVPGAIRAIALHNCTWNSCTFSRLGNYALELAEDCQYNIISDCSFQDLGGGGIKIGHKQPSPSGFEITRGNHHNQVLNNYLADGGKFFHSAVAIALSKSHHNVIARNHIHDYYYTGITVMGTWSFQPTQAYQNLIEQNHIHHIGRLTNGDGPILSDMGGVYILGYQEGTKIRNNQIHDVSALRYGGWGIYLDEGSSYVTVESNLVHHTSHGGFSQHYGRENLIRHNVFAFGKESQIHRHRKDLETASANNFVSFRFENNIVYWQSGALLTGLTENDQEDYQSHAVFQGNIYWKTDQTDQAQFLFGDLSWQQWQKVDRDSLIIDPQFVAPEEDNFQLQPDSPAFKLSF